MIKHNVQLDGIYLCRVFVSWAATQTLILQLATVFIVVAVVVVVTSSVESVTMFKWEFWRELQDVPIAVFTHGQR